MIEMGINHLEVNPLLEEVLRVSGKMLSDGFTREEWNNMVD